MKLIKLALYKDQADFVVNHSQQDNRLSNIFGDKNRVYYNFTTSSTITPPLQDIVFRLNSGDTKSGKKYTVDIKNKTAKEKGGKQNISLGKIIKRELDNSFLTTYSKEVEDSKEGEYTLILSRSPLDIVRASDHKGWTSCFAPGGENFRETMEEAIRGGAIAYFVKTEILDKYLKDNDLNIDEFISRPEIFEDTTRDIKGISPLSRLLLKRYVDKDGEEIALPETTIYGENRTGFHEKLKEFLSDKQPQISEKDFIQNYKKLSGKYQDGSDKSLFRDFYDENLQDGSVTEDYNIKIIENDEIDEMLGNADDISRSIRPKYDPKDLTKLEDKVNSASKTGSTLKIVDDNGFLNLLINIKFKTKGSISELKQEKIDMAAYASYLIVKNIISIGFYNYGLGYRPGKTTQNSKIYEDNGVVFDFNMNIYLTPKLTSLNIIGEQIADRIIKAENEGHIYVFRNLVKEGIIETLNSIYSNPKYKDEFEHIINNFTIPIKTIYFRDVLRELNNSEVKIFENNLEDFIKQFTKKCWFDLKDVLKHEAAEVICHTTGSNLNEIKKNITVTSLYSEITSEKIDSKDIYIILKISQSLVNSVMGNNIDEKWEVINSLFSNMDLISNISTKYYGIFKNLAERDAKITVLKNELNIVASSKDKDGVSFIATNLSKNLTIAEVVRRMIKLNLFDRNTGHNVYTTKNIPMNARGWFTGTFGNKHEWNVARCDAMYHDIKRQNPTVANIVFQENFKIPKGYVFDRYLMQEEIEEEENKNKPKIKKVAELKAGEKIKCLIGKEESICEIEDVDVLTENMVVVLLDNGKILKISGEIEYF